MKIIKRSINLHKIQELLEERGIKGRTCDVVLGTVSRTPKLANSDEPLGLITVVGHTQEIGFRSWSHRFVNSVEGLTREDIVEKAKQLPLPQCGQEVFVIVFKPSAPKKRPYALIWGLTSDLPSTCFERKTIFGHIVQSIKQWKKTVSIS